MLTRNEASFEETQQETADDQLLVRLDHALGNSHNPCMDPSQQ
jgi:hypothetical protein